MLRTLSSRRRGLLFIPIVVFSSLAAAAQRIPFAFSPNSGQAPAEYAFVAHGAGTVVGLGAHSIDVLTPDEKGSTRRISFRFAGRTTGTRPDPEVPLAGRVNYLRGRDRTHWRTNVPTYQQIRYRNVVRGIDAVFYGSSSGMEFDFIIRPGARPDAIVLAVDGAEAVRLESGDAVIRAGGAHLLLKRPDAYQLDGAQRSKVPVRFLLKNGKLKFVVGEYDRRRTLIIDPVLTYSTFLGGSGADEITAAATDAAGNVYVAGTTASADFPLQSPYHGNAAGHRDLFISKLDPTGAHLVFSTYIGGSGEDQATGIALDASGNVIVAGKTASADFPTRFSIATYTGTDQTYAFVLALDPSGTQLNYSSLIARVEAASPVALARGITNAAVVSGLTSDPDFVVTPGTVGNSVPPAPWKTLFAAKLAADGSLIYSTVVPGSLDYAQYANFRNEFRPSQTSLDSAGNLYVAGAAGPGLPTTAGALSRTFSGLPDTEGFVLRLNPNASAIVYATYLPENAAVSALAMAPDGSAYLGGTTSSKAFPVTAAAFQNEIPPGNCQCNAGFIAKLDPDGAHLEFATYLAGTADTSGAGTAITSLAIDEDGDLVIGGFTASNDFPLRYPIVTRYPGSPNAGFVVRMRGDLMGLGFSTFLSGRAGTQHSKVIAALPGPVGAIHVAGVTDDADFPVTTGAFQTSLAAGNQHAFIARIDTSVPAGSACLGDWKLQFPPTVLNHASPAQAVILTNCGNADLHIASLVFSIPDYAQTNDCPPALAANTACRISVVFTPHALNQQMQSLTMIDDATLPVKRIELSGTALAPNPLLTTSVTSIDFGAVEVGATSSPVKIIVSSVGNTGASISNISASAGFAVTHDCLAELPQNQACEISVSASPTAPGAVLGQLTIAANVSGSPLSVALSVQGQQSLLLADPLQLDFGSVPVSAVGPAKSVTFRNGGNTVLTLASISVSGDFVQTTTCGATLAVAASCDVQLTFKPTISGTRAGVLEVQSHRTIQVALTGTGTDLQFGTGGAPASATVVAGQTASFALNIASSSGFAGSIAFTCSGAPQYATCTPNPATANLTANATLPVNVTVTTSQTSTSANGSAGILDQLVFAGVILLFPAHGIRRKGKRVAAAILVAVCLLATASCGGGGSKSPTPNPPPAPVINKVAPGTYTLTLTATSGAVVRSTNLTLVVQ